MNDNNPHAATASPPPRKPSRVLSKKQKRWAIAVDFTVGAAIVVGAIFAAQALLESKPSARKRKPVDRRAALVEVTPVTKGPQVVIVEAGGTVLPARQVVTATEVPGTVLTRAAGFEPGAQVTAGQELLTLDPKDYNIAVRRARSAVLKARAALRLELGSQRLAKREFDKLGSELGANAELALRKPQLAAAKAEVSAARAALEKAQVDVKRTTLVAPFDALVRERLADQGSRVGAGTPVGTLVGTSRWWVVVKVPADQLRWITAGDAATGSKVRIRDEEAWPEGTFRDGYVIRIAPELESRGRLAMVYVAVDDPLGSEQQGPSLLLGSWVTASIQGKRLPSAVALDRVALRDGGKAWVLTPEGKLTVRSLKIPHSGRTHVLVTEGLDDGDRVVTSDLPSVVDGMKARVADDQAPKGKDGSAKAPNKPTAGGPGT